MKKLDKQVKSKEQKEEIKKKTKGINRRKNRKTIELTHFDQYCENTKTGLNSQNSFQGFG